MTVCYEKDDFVTLWNFALIYNFSLKEYFDKLIIGLYYLLVSFIFTKHQYGTKSITILL